MAIPKANLGDLAVTAGEKRLLKLKTASLQYAGDSSTDFAT